MIEIINNLMNNKMWDTNKCKQKSIETIEMLKENKQTNVHRNIQL